MNQISHLIQWLALAAALQCNATAEDSRLEFATALGIPSLFVKQIAGQIPPDGHVSLPIQIKDGNGKPWSQCELVINPNILGKAEEQKTVLKTDDQGQVTVLVTGELLLNYHLKLPDGAIAEVTNSTAQVKAVLSSHEPVSERGDSSTAIDLDEHEVLNPDAIRIYFPKGQEELAGQARLELQRMRKFTTERFQIDLVGSEFGLILPPQSLAEGGKLEVNQVLIPLPISAWTDAKSDLCPHWVLLHEWAEITMLSAGVHSKDPSLRFAADGLPELIASEYCRLHFPDEYKTRMHNYLEILRRLEEKKIETYRFEDSFKIQSGGMAAPAAEEAGNPDTKDETGQIKPSNEETAGYACSFWLWNQLLSKGGPEKLKTAIHHLMNHGSPTTEGLIHALQAQGYNFPREINIEEVKKDLQELLESTTNTDWVFRSAPASPLHLTRYKP